MSFGDHLEELRSRLIKALLGVVVGAGVSLVFARQLLSFLLQPAIVVLHAHGQRAEILALSPSDPFVIYLKIGFLCGLILSMPWVLYQIWLFVASGLYRHERRFVRRFAPVSVVLFLAGVAFMYFVVLPIVLNFFVQFSAGYRMPDLVPTTIQSWLIGVDEKTTVPETPPGVNAVVPVRPGAPEHPSPGDVWVDTGTRRLNVQTRDGVLSIPLERADQETPLASQFGLSFYVSFVLMLSLAFGLAFEVPVAVVFLVATRIVTVEALSHSRRYVIFVIFIVAAILTPPDVLSQILLAVPMLILFESGLFVGRMIERGRVDVP